MKITISLNDFRREFEQYGRHEQFSYNALEVIFDYYENLEQETGEELELDVIAICCDVREETPEEIASNYGIDLSDCETDEDKAETVRDYLRDHTSTLGEADGKIIYMQF